MTKHQVFYYKAVCKIVGRFLRKITNEENHRLKKKLPTKMHTPVKTALLYDILLK